MAFSIPADFKRGAVEPFARVNGAEVPCRFSADGLSIILDESVPTPRGPDKETGRPADAVLIGTRPPRP